MTFGAVDTNLKYFPLIRIVGNLGVSRNNLSKINLKVLDRTRGDTKLFICYNSRRSVINRPVRTTIKWDADN